MREYASVVEAVMTRQAIGVIVLTELPFLLSLWTSAEGGGPRGVMMTNVDKSGQGEGGVSFSQFYVDVLYG